MPWDDKTKFELYALAKWCESKVETLEKHAMSNWRIEQKINEAKKEIRRLEDEILSKTAYIRGLEEGAELQKKELAEKATDERI